MAQQAKSDGKALILKGSKFRAKLQVTVPAVNPGPPAPDPTPIYHGTGSFVTTNTVAKAG